MRQIETGINPAIHRPTQSKRARPPAAPSEVLPTGTSKYDVLRLVRRLRKPLGLTETDLSVLSALADPTRAEDWADPFKNPMNYQMQSEMALRVGIEARSFRRSEARLERLKLIAKNVPMNGYRAALRSYSLEQTAYGISLQPLIDQYEELHALDAALEEDREHAARLRMQGRILRRRITKDIEAATGFEDDDPLYIEYLSFKESWPVRPSTIKDIFALEDQLSALETFADYVVENSQVQSKLSGASDSGVRCHIQTIRANTVSCNDTSSIRTDGKPSKANKLTPPPNGSGENKENKCGEVESSLNPHFLDNLSPEVLLEIATQEWAFYVDSLKQPGRSISWEDFEMAAVHMLRELGISASAYEEALATMGPIDAMLALMVIDRNQTHPTRPVHSPGGALRAFARRREAGNLNLQNSIFGVLQRGGTVQ